MKNYFFYEEEIKKFKYLLNLILYEHKRRPHSYLA